ncbi:MAG TPA: glycosyltransferase family 4 protein [Candidatus Acidoferrum sp.]|nr:glycosyltransferase family 4 protein [Candidatus Acidoferrum sp.]
MKLLIYSHSYAPSVGGVETIVLSLARGLSELHDSSGGNEFDITVVTKTPSNDPDEAAPSFRVIRQPGLMRLFQLLRECDVLHVAGPAIAPLALNVVARKPVVIEHHGYQSVCPNGLLIQQTDKSVCPGHFQAGNYRKCATCLEKNSSKIQSWAKLLLMFPRCFLANHASANLAVSNYSLRRCALPRSTLIYHGIAEPVAQTSHDCSERDASQGTCFAYVGRLVSEKGVSTLLEAAGILRDEGHRFEVRIIGDGPELSKLREKIIHERLESTFKLTGFLTGEAFAQSMWDVQVVIMPSVWEETAGLAAMEQMMRGRLVIASNIGGLGEVVGDAGMKCEPADPAGLADAMRKVLLQPTLIDSYGHLARKRAKELFALDRMIEEHAQVYRAVSMGPSWSSGASSDLSQMTGSPCVTSKVNTRP